MGNKYRCDRLEPMCNPAHHPSGGQVCSVIIGLQAIDEDVLAADENARWPGYVDGTWTPDGDCPTVEEWNAMADTVVSQFAADNGWISNLDSQVESDRERAVAAVDYEKPAITIDTTVEPAEGSPAAPEPEPEPEPAPEPPAPAPEPEPEEEEEAEEEEAEEEEAEEEEAEEEEAEEEGA